MIPVLSGEEMRAADRRTIQEVGLPGAVLMENAGAAVAQAIERRFPGCRRPLVLCGKGSNGGDGFVVARRLLALQPTVLLLGAASEVKGDAALHLGALVRAGGRVKEVPDGGAWQAARGLFGEADLVVDAVLGTGLRDAPSGLAAAAIADLVALHSQRGTPVVAVDIPSGLSSDSGRVEWDAASAALTVAFAAPKWGHVLPPACERVGELVVAEIGIPHMVLLETGARLFLIESADAARAFPAREPGAHKGRFGHVLVVAGSVGKTGAAVLTAVGALRAGAGLVSVATPREAWPLVAAGRAELMTQPLPTEPDGGLGEAALGRVLELTEGKQAIVLGPGLGQAESTRSFVAGLLQGSRLPAVVDADALNAIAGRERPDSSGFPGLPRAGVTVLTPHPGEMARLLGRSTTDVQDHRVEAARMLASASSALVVLKGQRSVVAEPRGDAAVCPTGNAGMATAGSGDVLSGVLGALLAKGREPWPATTAGVYLHGLAGDLAAARLGQESLVAGDLIDELGRAIAALREGAEGRDS